MKFKYQPEGAETAKEWDFDPNKLMSPEAVAIEKVTGMTFGEWVDALDSHSVIALHALLWVLLKRETPTLRHDQVVFAVGEVSLDMTDDEVVEGAAKLRERIASGEVLDEQTQRIADIIIPAADDLLARRGETASEPESSDDAGQDHASVAPSQFSTEGATSGGDEGKATPPVATSTGGSSLTSSTALPPSSTV